MARDAQLGLGAVFFLAGVQQTELHFSLRLQRKDQELKSGWKEGETLVAHCIHHFSWWTQSAYGAPSAAEGNRGWRELLGWLLHFFPIRSRAVGRIQCRTDNTGDTANVVPPRTAAHLI